MVVVSASKQKFLQIPDHPQNQVDKDISKLFGDIKTSKKLRQVLFDIRAGNSNLAKSLCEKSNPAMYQHENPRRCLLSLQN